MLDDGCGADMANTRAIATLITLPLWVALSLAGCDKPEKPHPAGPGMAKATAELTVEQVPAPKIDNELSALTPEQQSIPVATIGARTVTLGELEARLGRQPEAVRAQYGTVARRREFLLNWVQFEVLADEAARRGFDKDPEVVETARSQMVRRFLEEAVFEAVTPESVTEDEMKAYYQANLRLYQRPEAVEVRHIQVADGKLAARIHDEIVAGGEAVPAKIMATWKDYVERYTEDDTTKAELGSLGMVWSKLPADASPQEQGLHDSLPKEIRDAALALGPYDVSPVVHSPRGFHILLVVSKSPKLEAALDVVQDQIRSRLVKRKRDVARTELVAGLQAKAKVETNDEAIALLPEPGKRPHTPKAGGHGDGHDHEHH
jgi:peptidyl-prolyl cis-trans isomerase C